LGAASAQFPNSKTLQPLPSPDIKPNISGNINSVNTVTAIEPVPDPLTNPQETEIIQPPQQNNSIKIPEQPKNNDSGYRVITYVSLILIAIVLVVYFTKRKIS
jgi:hypothetical protein